MGLIYLDHKNLPRELQGWRCEDCEREFWATPEQTKGEEHIHPICPWCGEEEE